MATENNSVTPAPTSIFPASRMAGVRPRMPATSMLRNMQRGTSISQPASTADQLPAPSNAAPGSDAGLAINLNGEHPALSSSSDQKAEQDQTSSTSEAESSAHQGDDELLSGDAFLNDLIGIKPAPPPPPAALVDAVQEFLAEGSAAAPISGQSDTAANKGSDEPVSAALDVQQDQVESRDESAEPAESDESASSENTQEKQSQADDPSQARPVILPRMPGIQSSMLARSATIPKRPPAPVSEQNPETQAQPDQPSPAKIARVNMAAVKTLVPLVGALAGADPASRPAKLTDLLAGVTRAASDIVLELAPFSKNREWMMGQIAQMMASEAAAQYARGQSFDPSSITSTILAILKKEEENGLGDAFTKLDYSELYLYAPDDTGVTKVDEDIERARLTVSATAATWDLYNKIMDSVVLAPKPAPPIPRKSAFGAIRTLEEAMAQPAVDEREETPYGLSGKEVARLLAGHVIRMSQSRQLPIKSRDNRISHLQGTMRRLADLLGSVYQAKTKLVVEWIESVRGTENFEEVKKNIREKAVSAFEQMAQMALKTYDDVEANARSMLVFNTPGEDSSSADPDPDPARTQQAQSN